MFAYIWKDTLLPPALSSTAEGDSGLPPAQFSGDGGGYGGAQFAAGGTSYRDEPAGAPATVL